MRRNRNAKIIATLGPASDSKEEILTLFKAGVDVFRLNFSHGSHEEHKKRYDSIRAIEQELGRPIGVLMDLQGPKLRLGKFTNGEVTLKRGDKFRLNLGLGLGDQEQASMPHPEIFEVLTSGQSIMINDGRVRVQVDECNEGFVDTTVIVGGEISDRKGVNVPDAKLPMSPLTKKDISDLKFGLEMGVDWIALSFVQTASDVKELSKLVNGKAKIISKLEKPLAIENLEEIIEVSDAVMIARGDLGIELLPESVPAVQKDICRACRKTGTPVIVATHMMDSMVHSPTPTRAEVQDVAAALYDGADAVMLSAETAAGEFPLMTVEIMNRIITSIEADSHYRRITDDNHPEPNNTSADAICSSLRLTTHIINPATTVTYTSSGFSSIRAARERPEVPILSITPSIHVARSLALVWGVHSVNVPVELEGDQFSEIVEQACRIAKEEEFAKTGDKIVIAAGMPFGKSGTTNILRIATIK